MIDGMLVKPVMLVATALTVAIGASQDGAPVSLDPYAARVVHAEVPKSLYRFDESTGTVAHDLVGNVDGTYSRGVTLGQHGALDDTLDTAAGFDGTDGTVDLGDEYDFAGTDPFSVELWMKRGSGGEAASWRRLISKEGDDATRAGWTLYVNPQRSGEPAGTVSFERRDSKGGSDLVTSSTVARVGSWHHVVATYDGQTMKLYVDGELQGSTRSTRSLPDRSSHLTVGGGPWDCCDRFDGSLDELAIYDRALSAGNVADHQALRRPFLWGVNANSIGQGDDYDAAHRQAENLGGTVLREDFDAYTTPGETYDVFWRSAAEHGQMILPIIDAPGPIPTSTGTVAAVTAQFAARYGPGGDFWAANPDLDPALATPAIEIWNEPYLAPNHGGTYQPADYAALMRDAYDAGKAANPAVQFLMPVDLYAVTDAENDTANWIADLFDAVPDLADHYDGLSVHPYTEATLDPTSCSRTAQFCLRRLDAIKRVLDARPGATKPFWITEDGSATCPAGTSAGCVTEAQQAARLQADIDTVETSMPYVVAFIAYNLRTLETDPADKEGWFGLLRADGTRKPAWSVYNEATQRDP
jgi:hypothetical protein